MVDYENRVFAQSCETMEQIPDGVVQTCVTSPPYFGLRDYGVDGQIGLESTVDAYVARLVAVFREVRRTLRDDGVLWLNLGDSYNSGASGGLGGSTLGGGQSNQARSNRFGRDIIAGLKPKDLIGIPWRVAFALQADGWWLRSDIIWHKPNPMPSSVSDRCTSSHEYVFMLSKSERYFFDADAIREPLLSSSIARLAQNGLAKQNGSERANGGAKTNGNMKAVYKHDHARQTSQQLANRVWDDPAALARLVEQGANKRDVWTIATTPYSDAHFATFPPELPTLCIRAGSREGDLVLDPFMGSGTVAEVAEGLGRRWVGYEINPAYHELIAERTRQKGLFTR